MSFFGVRFEVVVGGNYPPCLKLVRIMLETSNLVCKYKPICSFRKYIFYYLGLLNFADISIFCKKLGFLFKKVHLLKAIAWELCYRFFSSVFSFCKAKGYYYWKHNVCRLVARIWPPDCSKLGKNKKNDNDVTISDMTSTSNFFDDVLFLLSSLVTCPSFMSISSLVLELWQFSFIRDWPGNWKYLLLSFAQYL